MDVFTDSIAAYLTEKLGAKVQTNRANEVLDQNVEMVAKGEISNREFSQLIRAYFAERGYQVKETDNLIFFLHDRGQSLALVMGINLSNYPSRRIGVNVQPLFSPGLN